MLHAKRFAVAPFCSLAAMSALLLAPGAYAHAGADHVHAGPIVIDGTTLVLAIVAALSLQAFRLARKNANATT